MEVECRRSERNVLAFYQHRVVVFLSFLFDRPESEFIKSEKKSAKDGN